MDKPTLYAQFDGDEIDGTRYALGDEISDKIDAGTIAYLSGIGRIAANKPAESMLITNIDKSVDEMSRAELEQTVLAGTKAKMADLSDDEVRDAAKRLQPEDETASADTDPDKPKRRRTSTEG